MKYSSKKILRYLNKNTYFSNILLLPSLITSLAIYYDSDEMTKKGTYSTGEELYKYFWLFLALYILIVIIASTIHHAYMYVDWRDKIKRIMKIDYITAPIFGIIMILLSLFYGKFLFMKCHESDNKYPHMYFASLIFMVAGGLTWVLKRIFMKGYARSNLLNQILYFESHTFFHYIVYTGVMMMLFLFMFENKLIYKTLFTDYCKK